MNRLEANDPVAMCQEGIEQYKKGDYSSAFEWNTKAAGLGLVEAHYRLEP
jgi:TPR repeat protein